MLVKFQNTVNLNLVMIINIVLVNVKHQNQPKNQPQLQPQHQPQNLLKKQWLITAALDLTVRISNVQLQEAELLLIPVSLLEMLLILRQMMNVKLDVLLNMELQQLGANLKTLLIVESVLVNALNQ